MSKKMHMLFAGLALSACFLLINVSSAQVVDPCWYGCPKDGCPGCGSSNSGSINKGNVKMTSMHCKQTRNIRLRDCRHYYSVKNGSEKYFACLAKDKEMFEECLKSVQ